MNTGYKWWSGGGETAGENFEDEGIPEMLRYGGFLLRGAFGCWGDSLETGMLTWFGFPGGLGAFQNGRGSRML